MQERCPCKLFLNYLFLPVKLFILYSKDLHCKLFFKLFTFSYKTVYNPACLNNFTKSSHHVIVRWKRHKFSMEWVDMVYLWIELFVVGWSCWWFVMWMFQFYHACNGNRNNLYCILCECFSFTMRVMATVTTYTVWCHIMWWPSVTSMVPSCHSGSLWLAWHIYLRDSLHSYSC